MPTVQLTDVTIRNLKVPDSGQVNYFDKSLPGFNVRISQGGTKTFSVIFGATRERVTIGRVGIVSLAEARQEAKRILAEHTLGKHRPKQKTFAAAKDEFLADIESRVDAYTLYEYKRLIDAHFKFGHAHLTDITQEDIDKRLKRLNDTPSEKRHAFVALRRFLRWCVKRKYLPHNPMDGLEAPPNRSRKRVLSEYEIRHIFATAMELTCTYDYIVALLTLSGQRKSEIAKLEKEWKEDDLVTLPETKNGYIHTFPLSPLAQKILAKVPKNSAPYFFPAAFDKYKDKPATTFNGWSKSKRAFDKRLKNVKPWTLNDLRRSCSTYYAKLKIPLHITDKMLNHKTGKLNEGVRGVYNRFEYIDEMRKAVRKYEKFLTAN